MAKDKDPSVELGQRMLTGWILLAECCPFACNVPLVESKKHKKIECVSCGTFFNRDGDNMVPINSDNTENKNTTPQAKPTNTPTPAPSSFDFYEDDEEFVPPSEEELAKMEERRKRNDRVSKIMGEKLLAGWTMLSDVCPNSDCYQPLMKDIQKQMWCLGCNTRVIRANEFDPTKHTVVPSSSSSGNSGSSGVPATPPPPTSPISQSSKFPNETPFSFPPRETANTKATTSENNNAKNETNNTRPQHELNFHSAFTHNIHPSQQNTSFSQQNVSEKHNVSHLVPPTAQPTYGDFSASVQYALSILQLKIHDLSILLSKATSPEEIQRISMALKECGLAAAALRK